MNKQPTTVRTYLLRGAFLLSVAFVIVMPLALGQTRSGGSKPSVAAAQANSSRDMLRSATQTHGSAWLKQLLPRVLQPASTYMLDDGTAEDAIGLTAGGDLVCLNEFAVIPGSETITSVSIAWGTPAFPDPSLDGLPYTVAVWSDPNGDGSPVDADLLTTASGVVADQGTNTFITTSITPTTITTSNFFVGLSIDHVSGQFPGAFDETDPTFPFRSWVAGSNTPGGANLEDLTDNDIPVSTIESFGLIGNWLIRADAGVGPTPTPTPTPGRIVLRANTDRLNRSLVVHLHYTGATTATVKIFRNQVLIARVENTGSYSDTLTEHGIYTYQVCEARTGNCSNEVNVRFGGP